MRGLCRFRSVPLPPGALARYGWHMLMTAALRLALALVLALTSVHAAAARTATAPVAWVEICADTIPVAVAIDATGTPVKPHLTCPDCVLAAALLPPAPALVAPMLRLVAGQAMPQAILWRGLTQPAALARGPPTLA